MPQVEIVGNPAKIGKHVEEEPQHDAVATEAQTEESEEGSGEAEE